MLMCPPMLLHVKPALAASYITRGNSPSGANPYTFSGVSIGAAAADRLVVASIGWSGVDAGTLASATIGGVSATIAAQTTGTNTGIALIYALVPSGTTADIVVTMSGSSAQVYHAVWRVTGQLSSVPYDTHAPAGGGMANRTATLDLPAGGAVLATSQGTDGGVVTWTNATERWDHTNGDDLHNGADATSATLVANLAVSVNRARCIVAASWQ